MGFSPRTLIRLLVESDVEFLLIGGVAAWIQGASVTTGDLDIMVNLEPKNLERLSELLNSLSASKRSGAGTFELAGTVSAPDFFTVDPVGFSTSLGVLDVLSELPGVGPYDKVKRNARKYVIDGNDVFSADISDVITSKETIDRKKDRRALIED